MANDMQRMDDESNNAIAALQAEFTGIPQVTRIAVIRAALRSLQWYIRAVKAKGWDTARIWRDVTGGG